MEIPSENSDSFIIHRHPFTNASLEVMKNDDGYVSISCVDYIAIKSSELEKTGFNMLSALKSLLIQ